MYEPKYQIEAGEDLKMENEVPKNVVEDFW